jgi:cyclophilin family peptidyl-prolyl cis-trans isomerase
MGWRTRTAGRSGELTNLPTGKGSTMQRFLFTSLAVLALGATPAMAAKNPIVTMETSMGTIKIELYPDKAPITVKNFIAYAKDKHYDGVIFHRVIPGFMIQGGGMEPGMREKKTKAAIKNESSNGLTNDKGTIAMARTGQPDSATAQFFINLKDNGFLNKTQAQDGVGYCVFGKVTEGMDVVDKIAGVRTGSRGGHDNVPVEDVIIKSVKVEE